MADGSAKRSPSQIIRTICLPCTEEEYTSVVKDAGKFRGWLTAAFAVHPELFPANFGEGFTMVDGRTSKKQQVFLRRIELRDGRRYSIRPSFLMPHMTARTEDVQKPLFLRKFGVPFWRWLWSLAAIPCSGFAWNAVWVSSASSAPQSARPRFPSICSRTNIIKPAMAKRFSWPRPSAAVAV